ncbi:YbaK/EbsC family protein [Roseinatronobacter bogoriensis]|uniref:YbaK/EbsC family protein n=1 Tax=Roseinatronobacter bogoriensis subsp. barguzinensis TaxID=441209 RepID=A0A2K8KJB8_9RHOB|nr:MULTISPECIES: YbaK/EbsC family protein [Rhodobaca]ATX67008.1 YbaK/EbsC family protein [Rhodobaca barguzinensis]MBB4206509.1 prolyl-tRNA editing enzyme YbaK/EbsC (Cys-tRNA(Pro) deacylase) [Rhodobaca bogoriensis DSM 18756]TDW41252.1 prolyl-tRNA editing enzyme YbaK/EbsC (Cys-tRNA(Pro) deacylase) [Rhodobaca barguzinensis]TDY74570.1 prolyl-tRNA editing enzyme YbaK/EbsC (Cys-tRNA(Pro) deacylase) [Rhodobaca bogoriensis DSM 18756]
MSKSLKRVARVLQDAGLPDTIMEAGDARTAELAAAACGCEIDQIVKSIIFCGQESGAIRLFLTAGGNRICAEKASALAGEGLGRADANLVRATTGFAIGGVSPVGHLTPSPCWIDPRLLDFGQVWAAAGTPRHVFAIAPAMLISLADAKIADFVE